jgi:hypothetical protein
MSEGQQGGTQGGPERPAAERAEALLDQVGERLGKFLNRAGQEVRKATARAREEAEDMWAEAQHIRRGEQARHTEPGA